MSLIYPNRYPGRWDPTSAQYPQGKFKNRSSPTAKDGSFCEMDWANDWAGFFGAILKNAGVTPNGSVDTATVSQLYSALIGGIVKTAGLRDVGTGANQIPDMSSFTSGSNWARFPDGTIIQRGLSRAGFAGYPSDVALPIAFPTTNYQVVACYDNAVPGATVIPSIGATPVGGSFFRMVCSTSGPGTEIFARWIAIGK